jgi:hypothetical protein
MQRLERLEPVKFERLEPFVERLVNRIHRQPGCRLSLRNLMREIRRILLSTNTSHEDHVGLSAESSGSTNK